MARGDKEMNMHRPHPRRRLLVAALLGLVSATSLAQAAEPAAGEPAGSGPPGAAAPAAGDAAAPADTAAPAPVAPPAAAVTATAKGPATLLLDRQAAKNEAFLDLNVRAFTPPKRGAVEAVVTLEENKDGGREVELGSFTIFPAKKFEAKKADDERGFRLDATQALADLGADAAAVKVKIRLAPLHVGQSTHGAKLTLGKVQLVPREEPKDEK
jgi:hypothetical protein